MGCSSRVRTSFKTKGVVVQHCEYTKCNWTTHFKMTVTWPLPQNKKTNTTGSSYQRPVKAKSTTWLFSQQQRTCSRSLTHTHTHTGVRENGISTKVYKWNVCPQEVLLNKLQITHSVERQADFKRLVPRSWDILQGNRPELFKNISVTTQRVEGSCSRLIPDYEMRW